jgi:hypothetical protein
MKITHVTPLLLQERFRLERCERRYARNRSGIFSGTGLILVDPKKKASFFFFSRFQTFFCLMSKDPVVAMNLFRIYY